MRLPPIVTAIALALTAGAKPAASQTLSPDQMGVTSIAPVVTPRGATVVKFVLDGELRDTSAALPTHVLGAAQRVSDDNAFRELSLANGHFAASFVFTSEADFRKWYTSNATTQMLSGVTELTTRVNYRIQINRFPPSSAPPSN